jgi:hypothetical protein
VCGCIVNSEWLPLPQSAQLADFFHFSHQNFAEDLTAYCAWIPEKNSRGTGLNAGFIGLFRLQDVPSGPVQQ